LETQEALFNNLVAADIGAHLGLSTTWGDVTRKRIRDKEVIDWATVAVEYRNALQAVLNAYGTNGSLTVPVGFGSNVPFPVDRGSGTIELTGSMLDAMVSLSTNTKPGVRRLHLPTVPTNGDEHADPVA
jgi:hypothetical protein